MNKIFYSPKSAFVSSTEMINFIMRNHLNLNNYQIVKNESGKPFLRFKDTTLPKLFLSVTHTNDLYFIAFSNENVGIDAKVLTRDTNYLPILSKFTEKERETIKNTADFLRIWTTKEATIKWLGGSIARDLKKLSLLEDKISYQGLELPCNLYQTEIHSHVVCVCSDSKTDWSFLTI